MRPAMRHLLLSLFLAAIGFFAAHGTASATLHCSLGSVTNGGANKEVVEAYDVFDNVNGSNTYTFTFNITCTGSGTATLSIAFYGAGTSSYVPPALSGPSSSSLNFDLCLPGGGTCTDTTAWNASNPYTFSCSSTATCTRSVNGNVYAQPGQNVRVGTFAQYAQTVYFYMPST